MKLIVSIPFAAFEKGAEITDPHLIDEILASEQQANVIKVAAPGPETGPDAP